MAALLGLAALLLVVALIPPVYVRGRVDSLHLDEENPLDWDQLTYRVQFSGLFGAAHLEVERSARPEADGGTDLGADLGRTVTRLRLFGFTKRLESSPRWRRPSARHPDEAQEAATAGPRATGRRQPRGKEEPQPKMRSRRKRSFSLSQLRQLLPDGVWLIQQSLQKLKLDVHGDVTYGFPDPFATGIVHGTIVVLPRMPRLRLQPDFTQAVLKGWAEFSLRAYPWQGMLLAVQLAFRPGVRSLWWPRLKNALRIIPKSTKSTKEVVNS